MSIFNWKPNEEPKDEWRALVEERLTALAGDYNDAKVKYERDRADQWKAIKDAMEAVGKPAPAPDLTTLKSRVEDMELWRGKLHAMLTEISPNTGKEKLSKTGNRLSKFYQR